MNGAKNTGAVDDHGYRCRPAHERNDGPEGAGLQPACHAQREVFSLARRGHAISLPDAVVRYHHTAHQATHCLRGAR